MSKRDIVGSVEQRSMIIETRAVDGADRTLWMAVSSETPVDRWFGSEVLVHDKKSINLDFMGGGSAPLLLDHDHRQQIGVVEKIRLDKDKVLRARVRFSKNAMASEVYDDVADEIRKNVSIGYSINEIERIEKDGEVVSVRVTDWSPMEVSIVSVPADQSVGVGRSASDADPLSSPKQKDDIMSGDKVIDAKEVERQARAAAETALRGEHDEDKRKAVEDRVNDVAEMMALGARFDMSDEAAKAAKDGVSLGEFRGAVLDKRDDPNKPLVDNSIGLSETETRDFSIMRLVRAKVGGPREQEAAAFELEACRAAEDAMASDQTTQGFRMPDEIMDNWFQRDLAAGTDTQLIPTEHRAGSFIDALRNQMSVMQAGATILGGLSGNVDIPGKNAVSTATWLTAEGANSTESEPTFRTVSLGPKDLSVYTDMTRRMRQQSSPDIETLVRADIVAAMALGLDLAGLEGTGAAGQPTGVLNTAGINKPTSFAAANPTFAEVVAMETAVADDNALNGSLAYIGRTNMWGALKTTAKDAGSGIMLADGNTLNGYNYIKSNQGTDGNLYFGNWADLMIGMWGGLDLVVDEAALALSNGLRLLAFQTTDVAVRHAESFAYNNDGA